MTRAEMAETEGAQCDCCAHLQPCPGSKHGYCEYEVCEACLAGARGWSVG